jgi:hypothetical protein
MPSRAARNPETESGPGTSSSSEAISVPGGEVSVTGRDGEVLTWAVARFQLCGEIPGAIHCRLPSLAK